MSEPSAPGWYPDPQDGRRLRWWSGRAWTDRWQDRQPPATPAPKPARRLPTRGAAAVPGDDTPIPLDLTGGPRSGSPRPSPGATTVPYGAPVSLVDAVVDGFRRMFNWRGRSSRGAYWWLWLVSVILNTLASSSDLIAVLVLPFSIALLGAAVRRMHDVGRSGWFFLVPFYNLYLAVQPSDPRPNRWG